MIEATPKRRKEEEEEILNQDKDLGMTQPLN